MVYGFVAGQFPADALHLQPARLAGDGDVFHSAAAMSLSSLEMPS
jgi:hypothetical protein